MGLRETPAGDKKDVLKVSMECGVISSHTAFIAVNKDFSKPIQGPLAPRDVPRPMLLHAAPVMQSMSLQRCGTGKFYPIQTHAKEGPLDI